MKKQIITAIAAIFLMTSVTFAKDTNPVPKQIVNELNQQFKNANDVIWNASPNFYKASFTVANQSMQAFFSFEGQLIGVSRTISLEQLPMALLQEANEKSNSQPATELFELLTDRGTEYYITFGTGKEQKTFSSSGTSWNRFDTRTFTQSH